MQYAQALKSSFARRYFYILTTSVTYVTILGIFRVLGQLLEENTEALKTLTGTALSAANSLPTKIDT